MEALLYAPAKRTKNPALSATSQKSRQPRRNSRLPDLYFLVGYYNGSEPLWTHEWLLGGREGGGRRVCRSTAGIESPDKDVIACIGNQVCERKAGFRRFCNIALHNVEQGTGMIQTDRVAHRVAGRGPFDRCTGLMSQVT